MRKLILAALGMLLCAGCASRLPGGAALVAEGKSLTFPAPEKGTVFLKDVPGDRVVFESLMEKGQKLEVDARSNRLVLDGKAVSAGSGLRADGDYQLYFKGVGKREYHPMYNP